MNYKQRVLSLLDFSIPGLEESGKLHKQGDIDGAFSLAVKHFRTRKDPSYLFEAKEAATLKDDLILAEAEKVMQHDIFGHKFEGEIDWTFNPTAETSRDNEWTWSLYRNIYWQPLARAYALTGEERYVAEFVHQFRSFYESCPAAPYLEREEPSGKTPFPGHPWRTIEAAMRIYTTWLPILEIFRTSDTFDEETWGMFLCSIHDHGTFLERHYSNHTRSSNWLSMESSALLQLGIMFPEIVDAQGWKATGYKRVMHEVVYCFDNDGSHMEHTPIYHLVASIAFLQAVRLCELNNITVAPYAMPLLEKSAEFVMRLVKPDFSTPMIGDADRTCLLSRICDPSIYEGMNLTFFPDDLNELRAYFTWMHELTGREDFLYMASGGEQGSAPSELDYRMQESGIYVMRTGWEKQDSYLHMQAVQLERGERSTHSHNDTGHLELMVGGEDILIDSGRYIYKSSCWTDWRHYFTQSLAHNTLFVDDHEMGTVPNVSRVRGVRAYCHSFERRDDLLLMDLSHNGYVFTEDPVYHRRKVVFIPSLEATIVIDYITGLAEKDHDLRLSWNFASPKVSLASEQVVHYSTMKGQDFTLGFAVSSAAGQGALCSVGNEASVENTSDPDWKAVLYCGSEEPKGGWVSYGYPVREPIGQIQLCKQGKVPATIATVIARRDLPFSIAVDGNDVQVSFDNKVVVVTEKSVEVK